jgi:hypothetical protein
MLSRKAALAALCFCNLTCLLLCTAATMPQEQWPASASDNLLLSQQLPYAAGLQLLLQETVVAVASAAAAATP